MGRINAMKAFLERNGIFKGWVCEGIAMPRHAFDYRLEYGFDDDEASLLVSFLNRKGIELLGFKFSDDSQKDIERLTIEFGIIKSHLAEILGQTRGNFRSTLERNLRTHPIDEQTIIQQELKSIAYNMINFSLPVSLKKTA